jgi:ATP-binding cassette, subfamily B, bacterial MsbA
LLPPDKTGFVTANSQPPHTSHRRFSGLYRLATVFGRPYTPKIALIFGFMLIEATMTGMLAYLLDPAIKYLFIEKNADYLLIVPLGIAGVMGVKALVAYLGNVTLAHVGLRMIGDLQTAMFARLMRFDLAHLNAMHSGQFSSSFLNDALMLRETIARGITGFARDIATLIGLGVVMFYQDFWLALVATAILPAAGFSTLLLGDKTARAAVKTMAATGDLATHISEALDGRRVIKAYGMEAAATERASGIIERRFKFLMKGTRAKAAATPSAEAFAGIGIAAVVVYAGYQGIYGNMGLNNFMSFLGAMMLSYQSIRNLSNFYTIMSEGEAAASRTFSILDTPMEIVDAPGAAPLILTKGQAPAIVFDGVTFGYQEGRSALAGLSFEAPAGKTVALVGASGAGKSTILNLLLRFYDPTGGDIRIAGQSIRGVTVASLRAASALVTQEPFLFDDTLRTNIAVGRPGASEAEIIAAATAAAADGFIVATPQGYGTVAGEGGVRLSGGQRQRIAIARAMLKDAPILLLDEATSALDSESERDVQQALRVLIKGRTTLVVAHRLSTIMDADLIVVIDQGRAVEQGTHGELLARGGVYARLYRTQFSEREPALAGAQ